MIIDIESYVERMKGRPFLDVKRELLADGYAVSRTVKDRPSGGNRVRFAKGHHENAVVVDVIHDWKVDRFGIGRPGKVIGGNMVDTGVMHDYSGSV